MTILEAAWRMLKRITQLHKTKKWQSLDGLPIAESCGIKNKWKVAGPVRQTNQSRIYLFACLLHGLSDCCPFHRLSAPSQGHRSNSTTLPILEFWQFCIRSRRCVLWFQAVCCLRPKMFDKLTLTNMLTVLQSVVQSWAFFKGNCERQCDFRAHN